MYQHFDPEEIVQLLKQGNSREVNAAMTMLYRRYKQKVASYIYQQGGSYQDAKDILQEVLITFLHLVQHNKFSAKSDKEMDGFLMAITRNKWLKKMESDRRRGGREGENGIQNLNETEESPLDMLIRSDEQNHAVHIFKKLDDICQKILIAFYIDELSLEEIAQKFNLASAGAAKVKKFRCLQKLKTLMS